jgi:hypothetical protein
VTSGPSTSSSQFASTTVYNTTFTPAGGAGNYVVRWTISNSPCTASYAEATITVNAPPTTATNGSTQTICSTGNATLSGNSPTIGTGAWTVTSGPSTSSSQFASTTVYNTTFTPAGGAGNYVVRWTISNSPCTDSYAEATITVNAPPTTADAGSDINPACDATTATLAGNNPTTGTGAWTVVSGTATITTASSPTSGVTGLAAAGTATLRWTISNSPCTASTDDVVITTTACFTCGGTLSISHTAGTVAPVAKSVNYGTVTSSLSGASKCWITQNLGSSNQASSATDATEASAGWYWQFNRKQGFKHDGTTRTPNSTWITPIDETSDWLPAQDPCTIELGANWRIPTKTEWTNADANGQTGGWDNYNETYADVLKLHAAGYLYNSDGSLGYRGAGGYYWSSTQYSSTNGWGLAFVSSLSFMFNFNKAYGFSLRCLRD